MIAAETIADTQSCVKTKNSLFKTKNDPTILHKYHLPITI